MISDRSIDMGVDSRAISPFLDEKFYGQMSAQHGVVCSRIHDLERQYKGIDVEILSRNNQAYIDEKVKIDNINNPPSAIAFEISSVQRCAVRTGWFVNGEIVTTHYLIGCVFSPILDKSKLTQDKIDYITATMVSKEELKKWLSSIGVTEDALLKLDKDIRANPTKYRVKTDERRTFRISAFKTDKVWMTYSAWLSEAPINLVVPKSTLDNLPKSRRYVISQDGFHELGYTLSNEILGARLDSAERALAEAFERISQLEGKIASDEVDEKDGSGIPY